MRIKTAIVGLLMCLWVPVYSQTREGRFLLNGSGSFRKYDRTQKDTSRTVNWENNNQYYNLYVRAGYFIADELALGVTLGFGASQYGQRNVHSSSFVNESSTKTNFFTVGLFGRAYTRPLGRKFVLFGQLDVYYQTGKGETRTKSLVPYGSNIDTKTYEEVSGRAAILSGGVGYFFTDRLQLEAGFGSFGFSSTTTKSFDEDMKPGYTSTDSNLGAALNLSTVNLGITFFIGNGKTAEPADKK